MSGPPGATAPPGVHDTSLPSQLDGMVQRAYSISFALANLHSSVNEDVACRFESTIDLLDDLVRRTRHVTFDLALQARGAPPDQLAAPASSDPSHDPIEQAARTLSNADQTLTTLWNQAQSANGNGHAVRDRLTEASRFLRRAAAALDESTLR